MTRPRPWEGNFSPAAWLWRDVRPYAIIIPGSGWKSKDNSARKSVIPAKLHLTQQLNLFLGEKAPGPKFEPTELEAPLPDPAERLDGQTSLSTHASDLPVSALMNDYREQVRAQTVYLGGGQGYSIQGHGA